MQNRSLYNDFPTFLRQYFPYNVQKISINAGFTCPNRDGTKGKGGCTYCNNQTFNPAYCHTELSVSEQLEKGKKFFAYKYPDMKYLAYFQAYTNTYGELDVLRAKYEEALKVDDVVGLVIGTRPDCMPESLLTYLSELNKRHFVLVEYGIESTDEKTLERINRGHTFLETKEAIRRTKERGILVGGHVILGLPGETKARLIEQAQEISDLPLDIIKLHQLQLIKGTRMAMDYRENPEDFHFFDCDSYLELVISYLENLRPDLVVERFLSQSPKELLIKPDWGLKNHEFLNLLRNRMIDRGTYQGRLFKNR